jgi:class 3 adenylate cyclase
LDSGASSLARYLPQAVLEYCVLHGTSSETGSPQRSDPTAPSPLSGPSGEPVLTHEPGALFFVDISGFVQLATYIDDYLIGSSKNLSHAARSLEPAQRTSGSGRTGEELRRMLNQYFSKLANLIRAHGGDVLKFAGDAIFAMWPVNRRFAPPDYNDTLSDAIIRAIQCGMDVHQQLDGFHIGIGGIRLSCKVIIGAGTIKCFHCGGVENRWEFFVAGDPLEQIQQCAPLASARDVLCSFTAAKSVISRVEETPVLEDVTYRITQVTAGIAQMRLPHIEVNEAQESIIKNYVPNLVVRSYERKSSGENHLTEVRKVSIAFVNFSGIDYSSNDALQRVHNVLCCAQRHLYHLGGHMRQFIIEDKGSTFIGAFGMPSRSNSDDPYRTVKFALVLHDELVKQNLHVNIGITTGVVITGNVGSDSRCEYSLTGECVNMAARIMAQARGGILCDNATYQASRNKVDYGDVRRLKVKGRTEHLDAFWPLGRAASWEDDCESNLKMMCGRTTERLLVAERMQAAKVMKRTSLALIDGTIGTGKSALLRECSEIALQAKFNVVTSFADALENKVPFQPWRALLRTLFFVRSASSPGNRLSADPSNGRLSSTYLEGEQIETGNIFQSVQSKLRELDLWNEQKELEERGNATISDNQRGDSTSSAYVSALGESHADDSSRQPLEAEAEDMIEPKQLKSSSAVPPESVQNSKLFAPTSELRDGKTQSDTPGLQEQNRSGKVAQSLKSRAGDVRMRQGTEPERLSSLHQQRSSQDSADSLPTNVYEGGGDEGENLKRQGGRQLIRKDNRLELSGDDRGHCEVLTPLVGHAMGHDWKDNAVTENLQGFDRTKVLARLLANAVEKSASEQAMAIFVDDAQWMDTDSWVVLETILHIKEHVFVMLSSLRHDHQEELPSSVQNHLAAILLQNSLWLHLLPLCMRDVEQLILQSLECNNVPAQVTRFVYSRSQGNPLFARELTKTLVDSGTVQVRNRSGYLVKHLGDNEMSGGVPGSLAGVLKGKIDKLSAPLQMCAKVASVIGREFDAGMLKRVVPNEIDPSDVDEHIGELVNANIIYDKKNGNFAFRHPLVHEVTYTLLPTNIRIRVHQAIAAYLEVRYSRAWMMNDNDKVVLSKLAYHWNRVGSNNVAINYLERAAAISLNTSAFSDAAIFLGKILAMAPAIEAADASKSHSSEMKKQMRRSELKNICRQNQVQLPSGEEDERFIQKLHSAVTHLGSPRTAKLFRMMGQANLGLGHVKPATLNFHQAINLLIRFKPAFVNVTASLQQLPDAFLSRAAENENNKQLEAIALPRLHMSRRALRILLDTNNVEYFPDAISLTDRKLFANSAEEVCECFMSAFEVEFYTPSNVCLAACRCIVGISIARWFKWTSVETQFYAMLALAFTQLAKPNAAAKMRDKADSAMAKLGPEHTLAKAKAQLFSAQQLLWNMDWHHSHERLYQVLKNSESGGDYITYEVALSTLGYLHLLKGETESAQQQYGRLYGRARCRGNIQSQSWALLGLARVATMHASDGDTLNLLNQRDALLQSNSSTVDSQSRCASAEAERAFALMHKDQLQSASAMVQRVVEAADVEQGLKKPFSFLGLCKQADVLFSLYAEAECQEHIDELFLKRLFSRSCQLTKRFRRFLQSYPLAKPRYHLYKGILKQKCGKMKAALSHWNLAVEQTRMQAQSNSSKKQQQHQQVRSNRGWPFERACIQLEIAYQLEASEEKLDRLEDALQVLSEREHQLQYNRVQMLHLQTSNELSRLALAEAGSP